jgi:hypothetical protein
MKPEDQYRLLVEALRLMAASPEEQVSSLPDFVCVADEVATTFGDAYLLMPQLERAGLVSQDAALATRRLDDLFEAIPKDGSLADQESFTTHPFWSQARSLAAEALQRLGEETRPPDLSAITWVRG